MAIHSDVLILGGGVIGLSVAHYLARRHVRIAVLDKGDLGRESSWAGAGIISPAPEPRLARSPLERLHALSASLLPRLSQELRETTGCDNGYLRCGGLHFLSAEEEDSAPRLWRQADILAEELDAQALHVREPALSAHFARAWYLPETAQLRNPRHLEALIGWCGQHGVALHPGCPVFSLEKTGARITAVRTAAGVATAERILIAAGAWTDPLLEPLGVKLGVAPVRGQIAMLTTPAPVIRHIIEQGKRYLVPRPDGRVLVGSTEEDAGYDKRTTAGGIAELLRFAFDLVPALASAHLERCWAGLRPGSRDGLPFLGRVPGLDNLFVAAGHFRSGLQLSPGTGKVMAELLTDQPQSVSLEAFRLDR